MNQAITGPETLLRARIRQYLWLTLGAIIPLGITACSHSCENHTARSKFLQDLAIIKHAVRTDTIDVYPLQLALGRLEKITSIISESGGDFTGRYRPAANDAQRWEAWFGTFQDSLCRDPVKEALYLRD